MPRTKPTAPRSLAAAPTNVSGQIRLTWAVPASDGGSAITDYAVQRSPDGTTWTTLGDGTSTATAYTATGLVNGTRYYFRVFARNVVGQGPASNTANAVPGNVLTAPRSLAATAGNRSVRPDVDCAVVQRRLGDHRLHHPTIAQRVDRLGHDHRWREHRHDVHGGRPGQRHSLLLPGLAKTARATSPPSNLVNAIPRTTPTAPRSLAAAPTNVSGQIRLTWLAPVVERRVGDHRLRHPTLTERLVWLGDDQRWCAQHHRLHA